jgi:hypothetical protein
MGTPPLARAWGWPLLLQGLLSILLSRPSSPRLPAGSLRAGIPRPPKNRSGHLPNVGGLGAAC